MKILQVIPTLNNGGAEHFVCELSNELDRQGHDVELLTLYEIPLDNPLRGRLSQNIKVSSLKKRKGFDPKIFFALYRFVHHHNFDAVHAHVGAIKYLLLAAITNRKIKFVATIHSDAKREAGTTIDKWSRKYMFRYRFCTPVTISEQSEQSFRAFYGYDTVMIENGVSPYKKEKDIILKDNSNQMILIHPARCHEVKNQELLLKSFSRLIKDYPNIKLCWVGNNEDNQNLFSSLEQYMSPQVSYLGMVSNVRDYMVVADAMCLSSKMEGMPMTIIESFSVGCPVLCTPVGGCINMIQQGKNGMMADDLSVESYYKMLLSFISLTKEKRCALSMHALESFSEYTIEKCVRKYLQVYNNDMNKK